MLFAILALAAAICILLRKLLRERTGSGTVVEEVPVISNGCTAVVNRRGKIFLVAADHVPVRDLVSGRGAD